MAWMGAMVPDMEYTDSKATTRTPSGLALYACRRTGGGEGNTAARRGPDLSKRQRRRHSPSPEGPVSGRRNSVWLPARCCLIVQPHPGGLPSTLKGKKQNQARRPLDGVMEGGVTFMQAPGLGIDPSGGNWRGGGKLRWRAWAPPAAAPPGGSGRCAARSSFPLGRPARIIAYVRCHERQQS